jgi:hypothetical protein
MGAAQREKVNVLGSSGRTGRKREFFLVAQDVDGCRFTRVRAARKRDLGDFIFWQIRKTINRGEKTGLPEKGHETAGRGGTYKE